MVRFVKRCLFIFLGGGGSAHYLYDSYVGVGGRGGGDILTLAQTINFSGTIFASGGDGVANEGDGGGGSGGSIRIEHCT